MSKDPEVIRSFLERLPKNLHRLDYNELIIDCNSRLPNIPIPVVDFGNEKYKLGQMEWGGSNVIFRARRNENNRPFDYVSEISYIPEDKLNLIKDYGRVNKPKESMFYGSFNKAAACIEAITRGNYFQLTKSVVFTVGVWKIESPLIWVDIPFSEKQFQSFYDKVNFESESIKLTDIQKQNIHVKEKLMSSSHFQSDLDFEVLQFFSDAFAKHDVQNGYDYMISNYYADRAFGRIKGYELNDEVDGISYPSIAASFQQKNIVLKPEVIKQGKVKFMYAMKIWMVANATGGADFIPLKQLVKADADGKIDWSTGHGRG
ncbi:MAG TPA: hypothetical protein VN026_01520 [Bacteroidia bacterium]|jgi:hypothetical protein|nr:hypothetical protein [Bacteroidia bacterium]